LDNVFIPQSVCLLIQVLSLSTIWIIPVRWTGRCRITIKKSRPVIAATVYHPQGNCLSNMFLSELTAIMGSAWLLIQSGA